MKDWMVHATHAPACEGSYRALVEHINSSNIIIPSLLEGLKAAREGFLQETSHVDGQIIVSLQWPFLSSSLSLSSLSFLFFGFLTLILK